MFANIKGKLFLPGDSGVIDKAVETYTVFNQVTKKDTLYAERAKRLNTQIRHNDTVDLSHKDFGCLVVCLLYYQQVVKLAVEDPKSPVKAPGARKQIAKADKYYHHFLKLFDKTVPGDRRSEYQKLLNESAPLNKRLRI